MLLHLLLVLLVGEVRGMVESLSQGRRDCHPVMTQELAEATLSPTAGTSCAAVTVASNVQRHPTGIWAQQKKTKKGTGLVERAFVVVVVVAEWFHSKRIFLSEELNLCKNNVR